MPSPPFNLPRVLAQQNLTPTMVSMLKGHVEVVPWDEHFLSDRGASVDPATVEGIFCYGHGAIDSSLIDRLPGLKVISNHGVGVDHIDLLAAKSRGIPVGNTPTVLDGAVADLAMGLLIAIARRMIEGDRFSRHPDTYYFSTNERHGQEVHGSTIGIVGMGNIGTQIAKRAAAFDMEVLYCNRRRRESAEELYRAKWVPLDELLRRSDHLVLIVPLTQETRGMIGARELEKMKPTSTLTNISRGAIVDTDALTHVLREGKIFGAALDVTDPEPLPRNHPLLQMDNVILTPHVGSATIQTRKKMAELAVGNLLAGLRGEPLLNRIA